MNTEVQAFIKEILGEYEPLRIAQDFEKGSIWGDVTYPEILDRLAAALREYAAI